MAKTPGRRRGADEPTAADPPWEERSPADGLVTRRRLLQDFAILTGAASVAPLLDACAASREATPTAAPTPVRASPAASEPTPTPLATATELPTATSAPAAATVALVKSADRVDGVRRAIDLLGVPPMAGQRVLIKANYNSADDPPASTDIEVLRVLVEVLTESGASAITMAERSGMGDTRTVLERRGVFELASEADFSVVVLNELADDDWAVVNDPAYHWSRGFAVPRLLQDVDCVVQTCNLKTHRFGGYFSMSLKNSVGLVAKRLADYDYMVELHGSPEQRAMIAEVNTTYSPRLIVLDGVEAFVSGGPETGARAATEVVLAGSDRIAVDAVGVAILRLFGTTPQVAQGRIFDAEQIARAVELGLGVDAPDKIRIVADDEAGESYAARVRGLLEA